ncbi:MAG TPA: 3-oxoadipate enol-lactonase, partial [Terriglobales bacterium]|nr:3-oxoadipate enol-lactonase [Terriglobales bacterium]
TAEIECSHRQEGLITMPFAAVDQTRLFYRLEGNEELPALVLAHSIGTDHGMWELQVQDLLPHFRILRYDTRGHGASDAPPGEYSIEQLARDALALVDALKLSKFAFCGLSLGGSIGQWLALHAPERLTGLILANSSPRFSPSTNWEARMQAVRQGGMAAIVDMAMRRFFSPESLAQNNPYVASIRSVLLGTNALGYVGCCAALKDVDHLQELHKIKVPTLVIAGTMDASTPWSGHGEILAREIPGAQAVHLPATHLSNLERPKSFTAAVLDFLLGVSSSEVSFEGGLEVRRKVLGHAYVDHALASTTEFTQEFQDLVTRYAWGAIWRRLGLDQRTRRLLVLATLATLGRWEEFRVHVSTALVHGLETCDIKEVLLQTAIYAGIPAANTGFRIASEEIEKQEAGEAERPPKMPSPMI